jgi:hypothetical protein
MDVGRVQRDKIHAGGPGEKVVREPNPAPTTATQIGPIEALLHIWASMLDTAWAVAQEG